MGDSEGVTALRAFGLEHGATEDDLNHAFRLHALQKHPDVKDPGQNDGAAFRELAEARDTALRYIRTTMLVPLDTMSDLTIYVKTQTELQVHQQGMLIRRQHMAGAKTEVADVVDTIVWLATERYERYRLLSQWLAVASAATGVFTSRPLDLFRISPGIAEPLGRATPFLLVAAAIIGLYSVMLRVMADRLEEGVRVAGESLRDKQRFLRVTQRLIERGGLESPWSRSELEAAIGDWAGQRTGNLRWAAGVLPFVRVRRGGVAVHDLARMIGPDGFSRLYTTTGLANGLLSEKRNLRNGGQVLVYALADE